MNKSIKNFLRTISAGSRHSGKSKTKKSNGKRRSSKKLSPITKEKILEDIQEAIKKNGCKSITVGGLFRAFGYKRRGTKNTEEIIQFLNKNKLHSYPPLTKQLTWNSKIEIYSFPVKSNGVFTKNEKKLQKLLDEKGHLQKLGLYNVIPEHSPDRTRDRMDFFARDNGRNVVVEVKLKGGGKKAVEQVLRYAGMLKQEDPETEIRKILITGVQDQHTAKAIHGMTSSERNGFEWYLYSYNEETEEIDFEKVIYNNLFSVFTDKKQNDII